MRKECVHGVSLGDHCENCGIVEDRDVRFEVKSSVGFLPVNEDRQSKYGHPRVHFRRTVALLNAVGFERHDRPLTPEDWPTIMILDKIARSCVDVELEDNPVDVEGYARCWRILLEDHAP